MSDPERGRSPSGEKAPARPGSDTGLPPPYEFNNDVEWLRDDLERLEKEGQVFSAGDRLPVGVEAFPGMEPNDLVLWVESRRALVAGDALIDRGNGLEIPWPPPKGVPPEQVLEALQPLLELPVELCSRHTGRPPTEPPSSARSPDARPGLAGRIVVEVWRRSLPAGR